MEVVTERRIRGMDTEAVTDLAMGIKATKSIQTHGGQTMTMTKCARRTSVTRGTKWSEIATLTIAAPAQSVPLLRTSSRTPRHRPQGRTLRHQPQGRTLRHQPQGR